MIHYRRQPWFTALSVLLLAVYVQAQAAGCCKIGSWFQSAASGIEPLSAGAGALATDPATNPPAAAATPETPATLDMTGRPGIAADHSCCPKKTDTAERQLPSAPDASVASAASHDCAATDHGCCLQGSDLNASGLASIPGGPAFDGALPPAARIQGLLPSADAVSHSAFARMDSGPPEARANLPLLI